MAGAEKMFREFLASKNVIAIPLDKRELNDLLKQFWPSLRTLKGLKKLLSIDIAEDPEMSSHNTVFMNYLRVIKEHGLGCVTHHKEIPAADLQKIVSTLRVNDAQELQWIAWMNSPPHLSPRRRKMMSPQLFASRATSCNQSIASTR